MLSKNFSSTNKTTCSEAAAPGRETPMHGARPKRWTLLSPWGKLARVSFPLLSPLSQVRTHIQQLQPQQQHQPQQQQQQQQQQPQQQQQQPQQQQQQNSSSNSSCPSNRGGREGEERSESGGEEMLTVWGVWPTREKILSPVDYGAARTLNGSSTCWYLPVKSECYHFTGRLSHSKLPLTQRNRNKHAARSPEVRTYDLTPTKRHNATRTTNTRTRERETETERD